MLLNILLSLAYINSKIIEVLYYNITLITYFQNIYINLSFINSYKNINLQSQYIYIYINKLISKYKLYLMKNIFKKLDT